MGSVKAASRTWTQGSVFIQLSVVSPKKKKKKIILLALLALAYLQNDVSLAHLTFLGPEQSGSKYFIIIGHDNTIDGLKTDTESWEKIKYDIAVSSRKFIRYIYIFESS